jgi:tetratricopeptide (TPR) repeat protein
LRSISRAWVFPVLIALIVVLVIVVLGIRPHISHLPGLLTPVLDIAILATAVAAVIAVLPKRDREAAGSRRARLRALGAVCKTERGRELPRVQEISYLALLDEESGRQSSNDVPEYIERDLDDELRPALTDRRFLLIAGQHSAGKTRTAYEAIRAVLPDHHLIAPREPAGLRQVCENVDALPEKYVLWLDELEKFIGSPGADPVQFHHLVDRLTPGRQVIVATIWGDELNKYYETETSRTQSTDMIKIHRRAREFWLEAGFTDQEDRRAQGSVNNLIQDALRHKGEYSIPEYFSKKEELNHCLGIARSSLANRRGAALVDTAVDCRRAGFKRPIPKELIEELHVGYLHARGGEVPPETVEQAWAWATGIGVSTGRAYLTLVSQPGEPAAYDVADVLVKELSTGVLKSTVTKLAPQLRPDEAGEVLRRVGDGQSELSDQVLRLIADASLISILARADAAEANRIGRVASRDGRYRIALEAYTRAVFLRAEAGIDELSTLTSRDNRAEVLRALGFLHVAEAEHRTVYELRRDSRLGPTDRATLSSQNNLARALRGLGRYAEAEKLLRDVLELRRVYLGSEDPDTLASRDNLARMQRLLGHPEAAEAEHRAVLEIRKRVFEVLDLDSSENLGILIGRYYLAEAIRAQGRFAEAETEHRAVLELRLRQLGPTHPMTLLSRNVLAESIRRQGRFAEAETEHRAVLEQRLRQLGYSHPDSLTSRSNLAEALFDLGRFAEAEAEHRTVLELRTETLGADHPETELSRELHQKAAQRLP